MSNKSNKSNKVSFITLLIGVFGLLVGSFLLCLESLIWLNTFIMTVMILSGAAVFIAGFNYYIRSFF